MTEIIHFTDNEKKYLKYLSKKCIKSSDEHKKKESLFKKLSYSFNIPLVLSNVATLVVNTINKDNDDLNIKYITISVLGINSLLTSVKSYFKFDEKMEYNKNKATMYNKLYEKIESSLASSRPKFNFDELTEENLNIIENDNTLSNSNIDKKLFDSIAIDISESLLIKEQNNIENRGLSYPKNNITNKIISDLYEDYNNIINIKK